MGGYIILLIAVIILFVVIQALILPFCFLRPVYTDKTVPDRGCKVIEERGGRSVLYEPDPKIRKYVKQYILSERKGVKLLAVNTDAKIESLDFDVVVFNAAGRAFDRINVSGRTLKRGFTGVTRLPDETAYVTLVLNSVDGAAFPAAKKITAKRILAYLALSAVSDAFFAITAKICAGGIFYDGLYGEAFNVSGADWWITFAVCAGMIALNSVFAAVLVRVKNYPPQGGKT